MNPQSIIEWITLASSGLSAGTAGILAVTSAVSSIKSALQAAGVEADTAQLDFVIADAAKRQAREDALLGGG